MHSVDGLRAISLLRTSTIKQTTSYEKDIPAQRELVDEFIEKENLFKIREFVEGGVSGFKVKVSEREVLQRIKAMAQRKEFDVLVVYYTDRIGRSSEESPSVIKYLNDVGIRVLSVREGEIKTSSHFDKLLTYVACCNNENESIKMSNRSTDYHVILTKNGKYRGGGQKMLAFGYRLVNNGTTNSKGRNILDVKIDPEDSEIVVLIYDLSVKYNMGARAIASYLNDPQKNYREKAKNHKGWSYSSVNYILNNPIYKGVLRFFSHVREEEIVCNKIQENLIIISEEKWNKNQEVMRSRATTGKKPRKGITASRVLLSGLVYCGHCGLKMNVWSNYKNYKKKDGDKTEYVVDNYKCPARDSRGKITCSGQVTYSALKIDGMVEARIKEFVKKLSKKRLTGQFKNSLKEVVHNLKTTRRYKEEDIISKQRDIKALKDEIPVSIRGESEYKSGELKKMIAVLKSSVDIMLQDISDLDEQIDKAKVLTSDFIALDNEIFTWEERYSTASTQEKKSLLGLIIEQVNVNKEGVEIVYKLTVKEFVENSEDRIF